MEKGKIIKIKSLLKDFEGYNLVYYEVSFEYNDDGDVTPELIDNVALTMTFRAKFYNEDSDALSIVDNIKDSIKSYLENLDQLDDVHFPNITTMIETEFAEYLIYFEFVSFNIYDAINQHIVSVEDMEMLSMVPEFLRLLILPPSMNIPYCPPVIVPLSLFSIVPYIGFLLSTAATTIPAE